MCKCVDFTINFSSVLLWVLEELRVAGFSKIYQ